MVHKNKGIWTTSLNFLLGWSNEMFTNIKIYVLLRILDELLESEKQLEVMRNVTKLNNLTNKIFF